LKTVILVLLFLHVCPKVVHKGRGSFVYAFEELENNLHPSLFRRLLLYIADFASANNSPMFITTHSSVALDVFGTMKDAQIIHVKHDGNSGATFPVKADFERFNVVSELGAKPSDLLQANGLIWVEGPSDRVYVDRFIQLATGGEYKEGVHYQCVFYGGALLANLEVAWDEERNERFVNLLKVNGNLAVVMDSDRRRGKGGEELKARVRRMVEEVDKANALHWVTWGKEIESYLPGEALSKVFGRECRDPRKDEVFFPAKRLRATGKKSYVESVLGLSSFDKIERALQIAPKLTRAQMERRGDWGSRMAKLVLEIGRWNA
jgi:predicted ATP-dependent endonuclease of OLD family